MKLTRSDRSLIAWTLYFCVLFNVFACGLAHGQVTGLTLNGVGGQFCSSQGSSAPTSKTDSPICPPVAGPGVLLVRSARP